jgi:hypothetical protein
MSLFSNGLESFHGLFGLETPDEFLAERSLKKPELSSLWCSRNSGLLRMTRYLVLANRLAF